MRSVLTQPDFFVLSIALTYRHWPADTKYSEMTQDEAIRAMETELTYLRQEVEFLKKISQLGKAKEQ